MKDTEQSEQMNVSDNENRVAATDGKGVQNTELNCETVQEVGFTRAVSEMRAGTW